MRAQYLLAACRLHEECDKKLITFYSLADNQDDAAQEERWRTTMTRETMKRFREQREAINTQGEAIAEVRQLIIKFVSMNQVGTAMDNLGC